MTQEESLVDSAINTFKVPVARNMTGTLFDIAKNVGGSVAKFISDKHQATRAMAKYEDKYKSLYGSLKLLGMPQGIALKSVYTPVRVLNDLTIRKFETIKDLQRNYSQSNQRRLQQGEFRSEDGITVADKNQYLMVLGNPGGGKSTFLKRLGLEAFNEDRDKFLHDCIPVMLELKKFANKEVDLIDAIAEEFKHFGFPPSKEFALKALESGKLMVLLDGLDEVPNEFTNSVMDAIDNLVTRYEKNRFIASCRIAAYRSNFKHDFQVIQLADFDDDQIKQFITNWFSTELDKQTETAKKCWETLDNENNKAAKELAQTPLLLTFLCLVYNRKQSFPPTRSRLYNKALDILLDEWAAEKRVEQEPIYEGLHTDLEKVMLVEIAYKGFNNDELFFDEKQIIKSINDFLADTVDNPKYLDGKKILNAIAAQQGIFVQRAEGVYSFSHLTLQEYLTALYINEDDSLVQQLIDQHLTNKRWKEVFLLVAGLKNDASKFLLSLEEATQGLINTDKLYKLLEWTKDSADNSSGDIQPVGKRAIVLAYAFSNTLANVFTNGFLGYPLAQTLGNAYANVKVDAYAHALVNAYANAYPHTYDHALKWFTRYIKLSERFKIYRDVNYPQSISEIEELKEQIPNNSAAIEVRQAFAQKMINTWLKAFHLTPEMVDLTHQEIKALDNYFYANLLMVECKKAAVKVSRRTWSEIESRMLMPFRETT
ncbi:MAG: NACHT domain-containing protein [Cyanobacteria bacterium P01_F01_bin.143]